MEDNDIKVTYEVLKKKHRLPDYEAINSIFEISQIDADEFTLRKIRVKIAEKLKANLDILEELIHPNTTVSALHECQYFSDEEKKTISNVYSRLMGFLRDSDLLDLVQEDREDAKYIMDTFSSWPGMKNDLIAILTTLKRCWVEEEVADKSMLAYFG